MTIISRLLMNEILPKEQCETLLNPMTNIGQTDTDLISCQFHRYRQYILLPYYPTHTAFSHPPFPVTPFYFTPNSPPTLNVSFSANIVHVAVTGDS